MNDEEKHKFTSIKIIIRKKLLILLQVLLKRNIVK